LLCCKRTPSTSPFLIMARRLVPLFDRILVERILPSQPKTASGIFLPETAVPKYNEARVVAVGQGKIARDGTFIKPQVKEGDTVLLSETFNGTSITLDEKEFLMYKEDDILAILEK